MYVRLYHVIKIDRLTQRCDITTRSSLTTTYPALDLNALNRRLQKMHGTDGCHDVQFQSILFMNGRFNLQIITML